MGEPSVFAPHPTEGAPWDVAIIGSGPAGLTAAIYTTRGALSTLVLAGEAWGGQLMLTTRVDNFPGFPEGIEGPDLMNQMRAQAERFGSKFIERNVSSIDFSSTPYKITADSQEYLAKSIIIATGAETKWLNVPGEDTLRGRGVSSCAPCDAPFFKGKEVIVVGGGDSAMEEALVLTKYSPLVTIVHRRDELKASAAMQKRVLENEQIRIIWDSEIVEMLGNGKLTGVSIKTKKESKQGQIVRATELEQYKGTIIGEEEDTITWQMPIEGVFVAIGHTPSTEIFQGSIETDEKGYIKRHETENGVRMLTSREGVFVAGDVHDTHYKQAITAAGFGCMSAMEVLKFHDKNVPNW